jgi:hypothetical protein
MRKRPTAAWARLYVRETSVDAFEAKCVTTYARESVDVCFSTNRASVALGSHRTHFVAWQVMRELLKIDCLLACLHVL